MRPIESHAAIGDRRSVALIADDGTLDWLSWPRCDSDAVFAALLDDDGGHLRVAPIAPFTATRRYIDGTNILVTTMTSDRGTLEVTDLMPIQDGLTPEREIVRSARCADGEIDLAIDVVPRPGFARRRALAEDARTLGIRFESRDGLFLLRSNASLTCEDGRARGVATLRKGERIDLSFSHAYHGPAIVPPLGHRVDAVIEQTTAFWRSWGACTHYDGPYRDAVERSALALELLFYAPSGAVLAAPTTSLPERMGGPLNWDYRFCWLRDASLTVRALLGLGHDAEASAFCSWLLHATRNTWPRLRVLYDVFGVRPPRERTLDHLRGFWGSRPVRTGNLADTQLQLDVYGEVIDAASQLLRRAGEIDRETEEVLVGLGREVLRSWDQPDEGLWEPREARKHHTHSRLLCWVAVDRLLDLHRRGIIRRLDVAKFERARDDIRHELESRAWNEALGSYVSVLDGDELDASTLLLSWYGFEGAASPRMRATCRAIRASLGTPRGLRRYDANEGAFAICGFWAVEQLARGGDVDEAHALFRELLATTNDVGLLAEEIDPDTGAQLGNFPQAFSHVGVINAALTLAEVTR